MDYSAYDCMIPGYQSTLVADIKKAIHGEYNAIACYQKLIGAAPSAEGKKVIGEIRKDEIKHYRKFCRIYSAMTGRAFRPQISEECPGNYREGLRAAFKDEQETVDFYLEVADKTGDPFIAEPFRRAAADEQNHAVWFSFFYYNI